MLRQVHNIGRRRAWVIWAVGPRRSTSWPSSTAPRSGSPGLLAADRFDISAAQLSTFTVVQLAVYAAMQIPVGVLIDRFGSKKLLLTGLLLMTVGQFWFAFAGSFEVGLAARILLGAGDAMVFTSLLRLVAVWFRVKQAPFITQLTGMVGQAGAILAATPLSAALATWGWTRSFGTAAGVGVVLVGLPRSSLVKDSPYRGRGGREDQGARPRQHAGRGVGQPRHPARPVGPLLLAVRRHRLHDAVGLPVPRARRGPRAADGLAPPRRHDPDGDGRRPARRHLHLAGALPALAARPRHRRGDHARLGGRPALAGPGAAVAARRPRRRHGDRAARARWSASTSPAPSTPRRGSAARRGWSTSAASPPRSWRSRSSASSSTTWRPAGRPTTPSTTSGSRCRCSSSSGGSALVQLVRYRRKSLRHIEEVHPAALDALRRGDTLLPGISRDPDD